MLFSYEKRLARAQLICKPQVSNLCMHSGSIRPGTHPPNNLFLTIQNLIFSLLYLLVKCLFWFFYLISIEKIIFYFITGGPFREFPRGRIIESRPGSKEWRERRKPARAISLPTAGQWNFWPSPMLSLGLTDYANIVIWFFNLKMDSTSEIT